MRNECERTEWYSDRKSNSLRGRLKLSSRKSVRYSISNGLANNDLSFSFSTRWTCAAHNLGSSPSIKITFFNPLFSRVFLTPSLHLDESYSANFWYERLHPQGAPWTWESWGYWKGRSVYSRMVEPTTSFAEGYGYVTSTRGIFGASNTEFYIFRLQMMTDYVHSCAVVNSAWKKWRRSWICIILCATPFRNFLPIVMLIVQN